MHRKTERMWSSWTYRLYSKGFNKMILQLGLFLLVSQTVSSDDGLINHISLDCQTPDCRIGEISLGSAPVVKNNINSNKVINNNNRQYPVYVKPGSNNQINFNNNAHTGPQAYPNGNNNAYANNNNRRVYNTPATAYYNANNNYYSSSSNIQSSVDVTPIQNHISYLNNLTFTSFQNQPQFSTLTKQSKQDDVYQAEGSSPYFEKVTNYFIPNNTAGSEYWSQWDNELIDSVASTHASSHIQKEDHDHMPNYEDIINFLPTNHGEFNLETTGLKLIVVIVSIWYLVIAVLMHGNFLQSDFSQCDSGSGHGGPGMNVPLWHINAEAEHIPYAPSSGDSSLQEDVFNMFTSPNSGDFSMELPDLSQVSTMCSSNAFYYGMNKNHMMAVEMVMDMFMNQPGPHEMMTMAKGMLHHPEMNCKVWYEALMRASHERPDMSGMIMPGPLDAMPDNFIPGHHFNEARSLRSGRFRNNVDRLRSHKKKEQKCLRVDGSVGRDNGVENLLWYFREDIMVNSHHWYWHLSYPIRSKTPRDRRGELFYFAHSSMLTRYNIERMCNGLDIVGPLQAYRGAPIEEGYNPHLTEINSAQDWTPRMPGLPITDIRHLENPDSPSEIIIDQWVESGNRVARSAKKGYFISRKGTKISAPSLTGIDILGNALEASDLSINPMYYGMDGYHNQGHQIIGSIVDPYFERRLAPGPMGDPATAMRDPVFYNWHTNVNNIFLKHKRTLKPYQPVGGEFPLLWKGVKVSDVKLISKHGVNDLVTFFGRKKYELSIGLSLLRNSTEEDNDLDHLKVCAKHLDHEEFSYEIHIDRQPCAKSRSDSATVRIFIAPKIDGHGRKLTLKEQHRLFVHLDLFTTKLNIGHNVITRRSIDSTLTIPFAKSLSQLQSELERPSSPYCGCGWPHHLLLPKGSPDGMPFDVFVMVTNGDEDMVQDDHSPLGGCRPAPIYCGIQNAKYPDARPMGYPWDRELYKIAPGCHGHSIWSKICSLLSFHWRPPLYLEEYMAGITNMAATQVVITHKH